MTDNRLLGFFSEQLAAQQPRLFLWFPVMVALGAGAYFALPFEPAAWPGILALGVLLAAMVIVRRHRGALEILFLMALVLMGFIAGSVRTAVMYTPMLGKKMAPAEVSGTIELIEKLEPGKGFRLLLRDVQVEKLEPARTPVKVRLTTRKADGLALGQRVRLLAGLNPPSAPVMPGGFDFQRHMFFQQIGAVGFVYKILEAGPVPDMDAWKGLGDGLENLRNRIAARMRNVIEPDTAPMAIAFVNGQRAGIGKEDNAAMQDAGLAHLISISGLHVGLFSAFVFFVSRLIMAFIPGWALKRPIKKYAAVLGFLAAAFYTVLAGSSIPTVRTLIMIGLAYLAIVLDRSPLSLRLVAFAGMVLLLVAPDSLVSASFQMSFAAVAALIIVFEGLRPWWAPWHAQAGWARRAALYLACVCLTTVIATLATAPFSVFHFQRLTVYGVLGNMLAVPLTTFVIMPSIVMTLLLMPFGMEWPFLKILEFGMATVLKIAHAIAALPGAVVHVPAVPIAVLICVVAGVVFIALWCGPLRWLGLVPIILGIAIGVMSPLPDVLVARDFGLTAYRAADGGLHVSSRRKDRFSIENWERMMGLPEGDAVVWPKEGGDNVMMCDQAACRLLLKEHRVAFVRDREAVPMECAWADVLIAQDVINGNEGPADCAAKVVLDKLDGVRKGAHALWIGTDGVRVESAKDGQGQRPWAE